MSMIKDLETARAEAAGLKAEFDAFKAGAEAQAAAYLAEKEALLVAHMSAVEALTARAEKAESDRLVAQDSAVGLQASLAVVEATRADLAAKLEKAEKQLAQPAFRDAQMAGRQEPLSEGGEAVPPSSGTPTWDEFQKIKDPAARTEFWTKNEAKLRAEMATVKAG
jgi:hypothetical protein